MSNEQEREEKNIRVNETKVNALYAQIIAIVVNFIQVKYIQYH
jgi:hypothetical protein